MTLIVVSLYLTNLSADHLWDVVCGSAAVFVSILGYLATMVVRSAMTINSLKNQIAELKKAKESPDTNALEKRISQLERDLAEAQGQFQDAQGQLQDLVTFVKAVAPLVVPGSSSRRRS